MEVNFANIFGIGLILLGLYVVLQYFKIKTVRLPFFNWWEETLEEHWPLENPPDWDLLSTEQKKIFKLATIGYCLRNMEASKK